MKTKPLILVVNDDGITAPGLRMLIEIMNEIGEVVVVAPDSPQSAMGHAITINSTLHCQKINITKGPQLEYSCSGTPADCVKLAVNELLDRKPDLCVSGINHGSNSSINVIYSGTMSAAIEAGIEGIPAIGFSLLDFSWDADFRPLKRFINKISTMVLKNGIPKGVVLNVNFPKLKEEEIKAAEREKILREKEELKRKEEERREEEKRKKIEEENQIALREEIENKKRIEEENMRIKEWEKKFDEEQRKKEDELIKKFYNQETDIQSNSDDNNDEGNKSN